MNNSGVTKKRAYGHIAVIIILVLMLAATTYALILSLVSADGNIFETGQVEIELNGGQTVFDGSDVNIAPGLSTEKSFTLENKGTADIYYRIYMENISGALQEVLTFEIYDQDKLLFSGKPKDLTKDSPCTSDTPLAPGEIKTLKAVVKMSEDADNTYQNGDITFDITVDAVQAKNNSNKVFD